MRLRWIGWLSAALFVVCTPLAYADETPSLEDKAVEVLDKVTGAIEVAAQPAAEAMMTAVFFEGVTNLALGIAFGLLFLLTISTCIVSYYKAAWNSIGGDRHVIMTFLCGGLSITFFIAVLRYLAEAYTWAALFNPPAAIALKLMNAL